MQALLSGIHGGAGSGLGALVGGLLYDRRGPVFLFRCSALLSTISMLAALFATVLRWKEDNKKGIVMEVKMNGQHEEIDDMLEMILVSDKDTSDSTDS